MDVIYLDNNATTRPAPEVVAAMIPFFNESFGNPSSAHSVGQRASFHVAEARRRVASCFGADPAEIIFTSGGTESDNLAILGMLQNTPDKKHIVTTAVEHEAVFRLVQRLQNQGYRATFLEVDRSGRIDLEELSSSLSEDTALVSVMMANNETGVMFPIDRIGRICRERNIRLHTDAVQAIGKVPIDLRKLPVDMLSLSAHKFHGPKGIGALYIRKPLDVPAQILGGNQERDIRGGTENVPGIVGLGVAAQLVEHHLDEMHTGMRSTRDAFERTLCEKNRCARVIGGECDRLPNTSMIAFEGFNAENILIGLSERGICASGGSACHSGALEPSRVLLAMGVNRESAVGAVRFSISRYTSQQELDQVLTALPEVIRKLQFS